MCVFPGVCTCVYGSLCVPWGPFWCVSILACVYWRICCVLCVDFWFVLWPLGACKQNFGVSKCVVVGSGVAGCMVLAQKQVQLTEMCECVCVCEFV